MNKKTTQKAQESETKIQAEDYYQEIIATRGAPEAAHLLADSCRKKDVEIKMLKVLLRECKTAIESAVKINIAKSGEFNDAEAEKILVVIDSILI